MQTCLVIDEFSVVRKIAARVLSQAGYTVLLAETAAEADALLGAASDPVELVIVSATLRDCPVESAIRSVRAHEAVKDATILASLVEANLGTMTRAKRAGAKGFVYRPFDKASMMQWLETHAAPRIHLVA